MLMEEKKHRTPLVILVSFAEMLNNYSYVICLNVILIFVFAFVFHHIFGNTMLGIWLFFLTSITIFIVTIIIRYRIVKRRSKNKKV